MSLCDTCIHKKTCRFYKDLGDGIDKCNDYHSIKDYLYLPCKPGDVVYGIFKRRQYVKIHRCIVNEICVNSSSDPALVVLDVVHDGYVSSRYCSVSLNEWGNTLFSSQTDAENAKEVSK